MKSFFVMTGLMLASAGAAIVTVNPDLLPLPLPEKGGDPNVVSEGQEAAIVPAGGQLVISHRGYGAGEYILRLTKWEDGRVKIEPMNQHVVDLDGTLVTGVKPDKPDPAPETDPQDLLNKVKENFGDDTLFASQLKGMREALTYNEDEDLQTTHKWMYGKMKLVVGDYASQWDPWYLWFMNTAVKQQTVEDYRAWVDLARESLEVD